MGLIIIIIIIMAIFNVISDGGNELGILFTADSGIITFDNNIITLDTVTL
jgi:hypothetical protein